MTRLKKGTVFRYTVILSQHYCEFIAEMISADTAKDLVVIGGTMG